MSTLKELAQKANEARKLATQLEYEAQSAHGERWGELRGNMQGPGLIREAEMSFTVACRAFREELVRTTGLTDIDLTLVLR